MQPTGSALREPSATRRRGPPRGGSGDAVCGIALLVDLDQGDGVKPSVSLLVAAVAPVLFGACGDGCSPGARTESIPSPAPSSSNVASRVPVALSVDGERRAGVESASLKGPQSLLSLLGANAPELAKVASIVVRSARDQKELHVGEPATSQPGRTPTLFVQNDVVAFGMRLGNGGYDPVLIDIGAVEVFTRAQREATVEHLFVFAGHEPVTIDDDFLQSARSGASGTSPKNDKGRDREKPKRKGEHDGGGDGSGDGEAEPDQGGSGRLGVPLRDVVAHHAKGVTPKEVVLTDRDDSTFVVDAKLLADKAFDLRLKVNGEGMLRFRQYAGSASAREIVKQLEDVKRVEVR